MKQILFVFALIPTLCFGENLFRNSSMDTGSTWAGDRKFETVDGNRVMSLEARKNKTVISYQDVDTRDVTDLVLKFRYRISDYNGRGFQIRGRRTAGGSTFRNMTLQTDGAWHEYTWNFTELRGSGQIRFSFELLEGSGSILLDDVTLEPKS
jgi:hypothetical protein